MSLKERSDDLLHVANGYGRRPLHELSGLWPWPLLFLALMPRRFKASDLESLQLDPSLSHNDCVCLLWTLVLKIN